MSMSYIILSVLASVKKYKHHTNYLIESVQIVVKLFFVTFFFVTFYFRSLTFSKPSDIASKIILVIVRQNVENLCHLPLLTGTI